MARYDPEGIAGAEYARIEDLPVGQRGVVRRLRVANMVLQGGEIRVEFDQPYATQLSFRANTRLVLDNTSARGVLLLQEYASVLEPGRLVDIFVERTNNTVRGISFWCHVEYRNEQLRQAYTEARPDTIKPDPLFAYRLAHAGKTERQAARWLQTLGHDLRGPALAAGDTFPVVIDFEAGRDRADVPDLECVNCHRRFEVKSRTNDYHRRFSHSRRRTFWDENPADDYNLLVYPDGSIEAFRNADLINEIKGLPSERREQYDYYVQLPPQRALQLRLNDEDIQCEG